MHNKEVYHGDIKPNNFFWSHDVAVIGDFGGAQFKHGEFSTPAMTKGYHRDDLLEEMREAKSDKDIDRAFSIGVMQDHFAMARSFYEILLGGNPPINITPQYAEKIKNEFITSFKKEGISEDNAEFAANTIHQMLIPRFEGLRQNERQPKPVSNQDLSRLAQILKETGEKNSPKRFF